MTSHDGGEELDRLLGRLPAALPDPARSRKARQRCHRAMARRQRALDARRAGFGRRVLEPGVVAGFSLVYLTAVLLDVLRWHGAFQ